MIRNANGALMRLNYLFAKIKSEAKTATLPASGLTGSVKRFGNFGQIFLA
jgi:hypothetical protein